MGQPLTISVLDQQALAARLVQDFPRPKQVQRVEVRVGPDYQGTESLWLEVHVHPDLLEANRHDLETLTGFTRELQEHLLRNGVTLFAYSTMEQAA